jgi:hypothetical protein
MNSELLQLIRETGYLTDAKLTAQQRYDLLTPRFWQAARSLGYNLTALRRKLWVAAGRPEEELIRILPLAAIQKAARKANGEKDPRKRIKETAAAIALLYKKAEKDLREAIDSNLEQPERMRAETGRIRRTLLAQAASWLQVSVPGLYVTGAKAPFLQGAHAKAAQSMATQEFNRFKEIDSQISRHIEEIIGESERRRAKATLSQVKPDYTGLRGDIVGHKTIDGKELGLSSYIEMLAINVARNVFNEAVENAARENQEDLMRISREVRSNSCQSCRDWAGRVISITGRTPGYPTKSEAEDAGIWHPHCIHFLERLDEDRYAGTGHYIGGAI